VQSPETSDCWYLPLVNYKGCKDNFDYSDHVVLYMVQYGLPCLIEISHAMAHSLANHKFIATFILAGLLLVNSIKGVIATAIHFHTREETIVAILVSLGLAYLPAYIYTHYIQEIIS
jgi:hypothetical protein